MLKLILALLVLGQSAQAALPQPNFCPPRLTVAPITVFLSLMSLAQQAELRELKLSGNEKRPRIGTSIEFRRALGESVKKDPFGTAILEKMRAWDLQRDLEPHIFARELFATLHAHKLAHLPGHKEWKIDRIIGSAEDDFRHLMWIVEKLRKMGAKSLWARALIAWFYGFMESVDGWNLPISRLVELLEGGPVIVESNED